MSRLDQLITELCPNGVKLVKIGELIDYEQPTKYIVNDTNYRDHYATPVLTAGQTFILGYTDEKEGVFKASPSHPVIIFDDFTGAFKWVDFDFKVKSSAMKLLRMKSEEALLRYVFHWMQKLNFSSNEHKRLWIGTYSSFEMPLPPLPIQQEIVRILDSFTGLEAELEAELEARKKQYEHYRDTLLSFNKSTGVVYKKLGELVKVLRGKRLTKGLLSESGTFPVFHGGLEPLGMYEQSNREANTVMVINVGASAGTIGFCKTEFWSSDGCYCLTKSDLINSKFMYYCLSAKELYFQSKVRRAGIPTLDSLVLEQFRVPVPPIPVQEEVVNILDRFDKLCNDISEGLPAEIEARRKQYEYYRDKLLTFKELKA